MDAKRIPLAYDIKLRKVGCVLLQAALGGSSDIANQIPNEDWLVCPTPDLKVYLLTPEDVKKLVAFHLKRS